MFFVQRKLEDFQKKNFKDDYRLGSLMRIIPKCSGKILDVGSGNGEIAIFLSKTAKVVYAGDNSEIILKRLKRKTEKIVNFKAIRLDAENFHLGEKFDLITACDIAEHLKDDSAFFNNSYSHLNQGGKFFISVPAIKYFYGVRDKKYGHYRRYTKGEIMTKTRQAGFHILRCQYWNFIGLLPYFVSEKIFKKALVGPARHQLDNLFFRVVSKFLYFWLVLESKISFLPIGLSLIILAEKRKTKNE